MSSLAARTSGSHNSCMAAQRERTAELPLRPQDELECRRQDAMENILEIEQHRTPRSRLDQRIADDLYHSDVHGKPLWRKHMTLRLAEEIRVELQGTAEA